MKNNNRRTFLPLLLAAVGAVFLLPRKVVGRVIGDRQDSAAAAKAADEADTRAVAALIKKAPQSVAYSPRPRRDTGSL